MPRNPSIKVSAVVLTNDDGDVALVRKHHTIALIFPGGKPEPDETGLEAAIREVQEELGLALKARELSYLGEFTTFAANEAETQLLSQVYTARLRADQRVEPRAEIAQLTWTPVDVVELPPETSLAPLSSLILSKLASGDLSSRTHHGE